MEKKFYVIKSSQKFAKSSANLTQMSEFMTLMASLKNLKQ